MLGELVWPGIVINERIELQIFDGGTVTGARYCQHVILSFLCDPSFFRNDLRPLRIIVAEEFLEREDIFRMDLLERFCVLNLFEHA